MKGGILVDLEPCGGEGNKTQKGGMVKGDYVGGAPKKMLADITNLQQENLKLSNQHVKQSASPSADSRNDQLLKENAMLMKLLASRNGVIESGKAELQKLQSNFQKLRRQNAELARSNSQMMVELNSNRQRLRELQLELGCKNGILKAMQLKSKSQESDQTFQADIRGDNLCNAKRRRMSKSQSSEHAVIKQVNSTEKVYNRRYSLRRHSMGLKSKNPGSTNDFSEVDDTKSCVSQLQENLAKRKGLTSLGATVQEQTREDTEPSGPSTIEQAHLEENIDKRRQSLRRQSARFKREVSEPTEEAREDTESSELSTIKQVHAMKNIDNERRESARSKTEDPELIEDLFQIDDEKFAAFYLCDNVPKRSETTTSSVIFGQESNEENNSFKFDPQQVRRSSVGRPMRRAAEKVQTYKEIPLNVKMRRAN